MAFVVEVLAAGPPERVQAYFADPALRPRWQSSLRAVEPLDGPSRGVGARWYDVTGVGVRPLMEVTEDVPAQAWAEVGQWRGVVARLRLTFAPAPPTGAGAPVTLVHAEVSFQAPGWRRPVGLALRALSPAVVRSDLRRGARDVGGDVGRSR